MALLECRVIRKATVRQHRKSQKATDRRLYEGSQKYNRPSQRQVFEEMDAARHRKEQRAVDRLEKRRRKRERREFDGACRFQAAWRGFIGRWDAEDLRRLLADERRQRREDIAGSRSRLNRFLRARWRRGVAPEVVRDAAARTIQRSARQMVAHVQMRMRRERREVLRRREAAFVVLMARLGVDHGGALSAWHHGLSAGDAVRLVE